jgi:hypothetical protein
MPAQMIYDQDYIRDRVVVSNIGCWIWQYSKDHFGYGQISRRVSGERLAHRLSYRVFIGDCTGKVVMHKCDNPPCCNPDHLELGTQGDNLRDAVRKGRNRKSALKPCMLIDIEARLLAGEKQRSIASRYNISEPYMTLLKNRILNNGT